MNVILSICLPTYNRGEALLPRLRRWLETDERRFEIVVSDNASTDGTEEALRSISDPRLTVVCRDRNVGSFENQMSAFERARGRYVMQLTDKDDIRLEGLVEVLDALEPLDVACGGFELNADGRAKEKVSLFRGFRAVRRQALRFTHPSGQFFCRALLESRQIVDRVRRQDERIRPYSTDFLITLALRYGAYASVRIPFVQMNLPPYEGLTSSVSYRDPASSYFTPLSLCRIYERYLRFLREEADLSPFSRFRLVAHQVKSTLLEQMTTWYRWRLSDDDTCAWYGIPREFRDRELARDLEADGQRAVLALEGISLLESAAVWLGLLRRKAKNGKRFVPDNLRRCP